MCAEMEGFQTFENVREKVQGRLDEEVELGEEQTEKLRDFVAESNAAEEPFAEEFSNCEPVTPPPIEDTKAHVVFNRIGRSWFAGSI